MCDWPEDRLDEDEVPEPEAVPDGPFMLKGQIEDMLVTTLEALGNLKGWPA